MNSHDVTQNLSQKSGTLVSEMSGWLAGNSVDILIASGVGIAIALVLIAVRSLGCKLMRRMRGEPHWPIIFARVLSKTNLFFIVMASAELVAEHAATPPSLLRLIHILFTVAASFQAAVWARELVLGYVEHKVGANENHSTLGSAVGIIRLLVTVALFAIAIVLILDNVGVNVTGLVAGLGIGGIAIGLAAQGIFSDLFAALSIIFDKPFRRGDSIQTDGAQGHVENIGLKTTRIRAITGEQIVVSNAKLLDQKIHNFAHLEHRRFVLQLGIVYQVPFDTLTAIPDMLREIIKGHDKASFVRCGMTGFGDSSLDFEFHFDVHVPDFEVAFAVRHAICVDIIRRFAEAGIDFAYPTQTAFTAAPDGTFILPYADRGDEDCDAREGGRADDPDARAGGRAKDAP